MGDFENVYIDSSVIVRRTLDQPGALPQIHFKSAIASELLKVEVMRSVNNRRLVQMLDENRWVTLLSVAERNMARIQLLPLDQTVLKRAMSSFPTAIGTLDAIHLATALSWSDNTNASLTFLTHDRQLAVAARACGLRVYPELGPTV